MSEKVAILADSNAGITPEIAKELGVFLIPMPFLIENKTYFEGVDFDQARFYQTLTEDLPVSTSQPSVGAVLEAWDKILEEYDTLVHIPMSSGLSASYETANGLAQDYKGRVQVVNNQRVSVTQRQSIMDALDLVKAGKTAREIREILEEVRFESSIYIMMDTLKYLKRGGRITPAAAAIATVLRIKPVLQIQGEKLDAFAKARGEKSGRTIMLDAMEKDINTRFGGVDQVRIFVAHTNNYEAAAEFSETIAQRFGVEPVFCDPLSLSVSCHIGPGALAIACSKKIDRFL